MNVASPQTHNYSDVHAKQSNSEMEDIGILLLLVSLKNPNSNKKLVKYHRNISYKLIQLPTTKLLNKKNKKK